jgi:tryptophan-rich sensory protein
VLNSAEKRFIKYWEEQRTGGKYKYYLLYILSGTFISVLILSFVYSLVISSTFSLDWGVLPILIVSFVLVTVMTIVTWDRNEKKFNSIIKREVREGQRSEGKETGDKLVQE